MSPETVKTSFGSPRNFTKTTSESFENYFGKGRHGVDFRFRVIFVGVQQTLLALDLFASVSSTLADVHRLR